MIQGIFSQEEKVKNPLVNKRYSILSNPIQSAWVPKPIPVSTG